VVLKLRELSSTQHAASQQPHSSFQDTTKLQQETTSTLIIKGMPEWPDPPGPQRAPLTFSSIRPSLKVGLHELENQPCQYDLVE
jgi:hypothetical protein